MSYYIMDKLGSNLNSFYMKLERFSKKTIYQVSIKLIDIFERIHEAGFIYNDLKMDNILVGNFKSCESSLYKIRLCDFGFACRYQDKHGRHLEQSDVDVFRSNMIFASLN